LSIINTFRKLDKLSKLTDNSKLYLYNKIKHDIVLEEYLIKEKSLLNLSYLAVFPLIEFLLPGQKFISTLLSDILTIYGPAKYFWIVFTIKVKVPGTAPLLKGLGIFICKW
jgi:hypothetical protein